MRKLRKFTFLFLIFFSCNVFALITPDTLSPGVSKNLSNPSNNTALQSQLYGMSNLSVPERKQEAFFIKINNLLNNKDLDNHSQALANILMANYHVLNSDTLRAREFMSIAQPLVQSVNQESLNNQYDYVNVFVLRSEGDLEEALNVSEELYEKVKDKWVLNKLGDLVLENAYINALFARYRESIQSLDIALDYSLDSNDPYLISETYNVFGILYSFLNDHKSAIMYFEKAIDVMKQHPNLVRNIYFYANLADSYRQDDQYEKALELTDKTMQLAIREGDIPLQAFAHQVRARVFTNQEKYEEALQQLKFAKTLQEQVGEQMFGYELHLDFASAYIKLGQIDAAEEHIEMAIDSAQEAAKLDDFYLNKLRSDIEAKRGNYEQAYNLLSRSSRAYRQSYNDNLTYVSNLAREQLDQERLSFENKLLENEVALNAKYVDKYKSYSHILIALVMLLLLLVVLGFWLLFKYRRVAKTNEQLALTDTLTKLPNRRQMFRKLDNEHVKSVPGNSIYSLIIFDIDHFKTINDRFGHHIGDKVIKRIASITQHTLREEDTIGRISGEEFLIILPETTLKDAELIAHRLSEQFANAEFSDLAEGIHLTASFGVTEYSQEDERLDMVINRADRLLYKAKKEGRNRVVSTFNNDDTDLN